MKEKINVIKEYLKYFPTDSTAKNNLLLCEYADELDIELKGGYYPRIEYGYCVINYQIKVGKKYSLTNSTTKYKHNGNDSIVIWNEPSGRLAFVNSDYYCDVDDEWGAFKNILMSYNPIDYDEINNVYIYDLKNGKRLINDYENIVKDLQKQIDKKVKEVMIENKKKEIERLQKELEKTT